jgi:hypothetical protein
MGLGLEAVLGYNADLTGSTTFDELTPGINQSFAIRNFTQGNCYLEDIWGSDSVGPFTLSIHSPKMHDDVYGILLAGSPKSNSGAVTFNPQTLMQGDTIQEVYATDTLNFSVNGAASDIFAAIMQFRYTNISGINARLYDWPTIRSLIVNYVGVEVSPVSNGTAGLWGTPVALNSGLYRLKANTDYAVIGYTVSVPCTAVVINGIDTGNLNVGGPGHWDNAFTNSFFRTMALQYQSPHIPVINSNNAPNITVTVADVKTTATIKVTLLLAQLSTLLTNPGGA